CPYPTLFRSRSRRPAPGVGGLGPRAEAFRMQTQHDRPVPVAVGLDLGRADDLTAAVARASRADPGPRPVAVQTRQCARARPAPGALVPPGLPSSGVDVGSSAYSSRSTCACHLLGLS